MRRYLVWSLAIGSLALVQTARAELIMNLQLYDGTSQSPVVTVYYTNADGSGSNSAAAYADPQVSYGTTNPIFYCVDPWHDNNLGASYTIDQVAGLTFSSTSTFSDVDNRIGWLLTQDQGTVDARAAVQLALWYTIDNVPNTQLAGFSFRGGDSTLRNDYNQLIHFTGYHSNARYSTDFWQATHDSSNTLYQNLVSTPPASMQPNIGSVPEPSSLVLAGIGALTLVGAGLWRRGGRAARPARHEA